ncbi:UvrABC system protein B [Mycoavidus cysteinexigens]|uniref:UvrABC system protein B n=1 Tax=Mycoavidus cysteinexigens TaxID=1553431 RepID=A0A2Z6EWH2_9BURK|nr:hypothetical protein [Mycoavidus cysteinexigens]BBE09435.1 UvrABC system protein B [Mycoavidus cysteinexigens]GAM51807.1 hypothetical protein EBME_0270 [bacterium endosymbiont of Mortierella elongata FMR23-6]GLR01654.1 hypothetical protein GCM10007934_14660 [Mycoavidus cysteinexigens]
MKSEENAKQYRYAVLSYGERFEDGYGFKSMLDEGEVVDLAQAAAECIGWSIIGEDAIDIEVFKEDGLSLGVFEVHKRWIPRLSIYPKNKSID